jgi:hypothetical protein
MPGSPRWEEFCGRLSEALWIDETSWRCHGKASPLRFHYATEVMRAMGGIDIEGSLAFFEDQGGSCDCMILFNVEALACRDDDAIVQ